MYSYVTLDGTFSLNPECGGSVEFLWARILFVKIITEGLSSHKSFEEFRSQGYICGRLLDGVGWSSLTLGQGLASLFHNSIDSKYADFVDHMISVTTDRFCHGRADAAVDNR